MHAAAQPAWSLGRRDSAAVRIGEVAEVARQASVVRMALSARGTVVVALGGSARTCCCTDSVAGGDSAQHTGSSACSHMQQSEPLGLVALRAPVAVAEHAA